MMADKILLLGSIISVIALFFLIGSAIYYAGERDADQAAFCETRQMTWRAGGKGASNFCVDKDGFARYILPQ